jgi:hypothetical protein
MKHDGVTATVSVSRPPVDVTVNDSSMSVHIKTSNLGDWEATKAKLKQVGLL